MASFGRPLALSIFNGAGQQAFGWATAAIGIIPVILSCFLDNKPLSLPPPPSPPRPPVPRSTPSRRYWPASTWNTRSSVAIVTSLPVVAVGMENQYVPAMAEISGLSYLAAETAGSSLNGISRIVLGILCDFVSPSI